MWHQKVETPALLDSEATENFINKRTVKTMGSGMQPLPNTLNIHNMDRMLNHKGQITQYTDLWVQRQEQHTKLCFYVTNLGQDHLILGHPWFKYFNPDIDWLTNALNGEDVTPETAGYQHKKRWNERIRIRQAAIS